MAAVLWASVLPAAQTDIDWPRARQLHEKSQRGETLSAEDQAYLERARQALAGRQQGGGDTGRGPAAAPPKVDWNRIGQLYDKVRGGQAPTADEKAELIRAFQALQSLGPMLQGRSNQAGGQTQPERATERRGPQSPPARIPSAAGPTSRAPAALEPSASAGGLSHGTPAELPAPPLTYHAISDLKVYPKPPLPKLGPAGFTFRDPTFGCPILRVSDEATAEGMSIVTPAVAFANAWNTDSTLFYVLANGGANIPFRFDPKTMTASRIQGLPFLPDFGNESTFSRRDPNLCFGKDRRRNRIVQYDFAANTATDVVDVSRLTGTEPGYMSTLTISANDVLALVFGGPTQDASPYLLVYDLKTRKHRLWNTKEGTVDGKALPGAPKFTQHTGQIDLSGRYVMTLGPGVTGPIVWDTKTDEISSVNVEKSGHHVLGYAAMVNDVHKWVYRTLDRQGIDSPQDLMEHPAGEPYFDYDSHVSWNNTRPSLCVPVVLSTYHMLERGDPKCVWGDEVLAVATDGSKQVWRFAHHRSTVHGRGMEGISGKYNFWDSPRGNVSQDGRFYLFTSNWEESVGKDSQDRYREDAFIVRLEQGTAAEGAGR
jgi:hypothetical protein